MTSRGRCITVLVIILAVLLMFAAGPVAAVNHETGETWTYDVSMSVDIGMFVVDVSGNVAYEFREERALTVPGHGDYDVNAIAVRGELSGRMELFEQPFLAANVTIEGFLYETVDGAEIVEEYTRLLIDATIGSGSTAWSTQSETQTFVVYTQPYLWGFDPASVTLGNEWLVIGTVNTTVTTWENGTIQGTSWNNSDTNFDITIGPTIDSIVTPAGTFNAYEIAVWHNNDHEVRWWSDEVNGYVKVESYSNGGGVALQMMTLSSYEEGSSDSLLWVALVGVAVALVAVLVLAVVLLRTRPPKSS